MFNNLETEKRNLNQFYLVNQHTLTELYRSNSYIEQLIGILKNLESLLSIHERMDKIAPIEGRKSKDYIKLINNISAELQYLKATCSAYEDTIRELEKTECFQYRISGRMMDLKKEINRTIKKAEERIKR